METQPWAGDAAWRRAAGPAWPTVALAVGALGSWGAVWAACLAGALPLPIGAALATVAVYVAFTPFHEAAHGNVSGGVRRLRGLDAAVGWASGALLLAPLPAFRVLHLRHHGNTNHPERDPDYWVAGRSRFGVALRCATLFFYYWAEYWREVWSPTSAVGRTRRATAAGVAALAVAAAALVAGGLATEAAALWWGPAVLATGLLGFLFDWLPHHPHHSRERWRDTAILDVPQLTPWLLGQNDHLVHHLYPRLPFYRYAACRRALRAELERRGSPIRGPGRRSRRRRGVA